MKRNFFVLAVLVALVFSSVAAARAVKPWYLHSPGQSGTYVCNRDAKDAIASFATKAACEAAIPTDGDDDPPAGDPPPVVGPDSPDSVFLCYSVFQTTPGVWSLNDAALLVTVFGYTEAQAVAGNVEGGVNVGAYNLVCNSGLADTGLSVGDGGTLFGADYGPANEELGFYALYA